MATVPTPKRGEVWLVRFDPSAGAEIRKVRPAVVVNLDAIGRRPLRITNRGSGHGLEERLRESLLVRLPPGGVRKWPLERLRGGRVPGKVGVRDAVCSKARRGH